MAVEIKVPALGESVTEATVSKWLMKAGDSVAIDQPLCELETDKVTVEVNATRGRHRSSISPWPRAPSVQVGGVLCHIEAGAARCRGRQARGRAGCRPRRPAARRQGPRRRRRQPAPQAAANVVNLAASGPAVRKLAEERAVAAASIQPTGKDGRATKADVMAALSSISAQSGAGRAAARRRPSGPRPRADREERVKMTRLRRTIANRLKEAQNTAAMLTTFNEVDMTGVMALRERLKEDFEKKHGARLGFMSFFVKACIAGAEGAAGGQCRDRRRGPGLQELLRHRRRRRHAARAWSCRCCATPTRGRSPRSRRASPSSATRRATASSPSPI